MLPRDDHGTSVFNNYFDFWVGGEHSYEETREADLHESFMPERKRIVKYLVKLVADSSERPVLAFIQVK